jgi:hypothetical protein
VWDVLLTGYAAVEKKARNKRGVTLPDVWYGKYKWVVPGETESATRSWQLMGGCSPYAEYSIYKSYPPGAEGQAPEMKRDAAMETVWRSEFWNWFEFERETGNEKWN